MGFPILVRCHLYIESGPWNLPDWSTILPKFIYGKEGNLAGPTKVLLLRVHDPARILKIESWDRTISNCSDQREIVCEKETLITCISLFVWIWTCCYTAYTPTMHVLFHYRQSIPFKVLFIHIKPKMGLWKIPPIKTTVTHQLANLQNAMSQACLYGWSLTGTALVWLVIGHYNIVWTVA